MGGPLATPMCVAGKASAVLDATGFDPTDLDVLWEADGARLTYGSGHQVFVPAEEFLFGR
jgi:hypothetical protein